MGTLHDFLEINLAALIDSRQNLDHAQTVETALDEILGHLQISPVPSSFFVSIRKRALAVRAAVEVVDDVDLGDAVQLSGDGDLSQDKLPIMIIVWIGQVFGGPGRGHVVVLTEQANVLHEVNDVVDEPEINAMENEGFGGMIHPL